MIQFPGEHSAHHPAGPQALLLDRLGELLYGVAAVVFVLVVTALLAAAFRRRRTDEPMEDTARERRMAVAVAVAAGATVATLVTVLFLAPSIARATTAGSMSTSSPALTPSAIRRRSPCS